MPLTKTSIKIPLYGTNLASLSGVLNNDKWPFCMPRLTLHFLRHTSLPRGRQHAQCMDASCELIIAQKVFMGRAGLAHDNR